MVVPQFIENNALLTYALATAPAPFCVSPQNGPPSVGALTLAISCPPDFGPIVVKQISFNLPVGDPKSPESGELTEAARGITCSVVSSGTDKWEIGLGASDGAFVLKPAPGGIGSISSQGLTVSIASIQIGPIVGTAKVNIVELASADSTLPQRRMCLIGIPKFPTGFSFSEFSASRDEISSGESVTLTWQGSTADYSLTCGDQDAIPVSSLRSRPSPPLYETTAFRLEASVSQDGQTVTMAREVVVVVTSPDVVCSFDPDEVEYGKSVVLKWSSKHADGIYFFAGQTERKTLGKNSDPESPLTIQPNYDITYSAQAFRRKGNGPDMEYSKVYPLAFTFAPMVIDTFKAEPSSFHTDGGTLSWKVIGPKAVTLQQQPVKFVDSLAVVPVSDTTYELAATWVDGTKVTKSLTVPVLKVQVTNVEGRDFKVDRSHKDFVLVSVFIVWEVIGATGGQYDAYTRGGSVTGSMGRDKHDPNKWTTPIGIVDTFPPTPTFSIPVEYSFQGDLLLPAKGKVEINETGIKWIGHQS